MFCGVDSHKDTLAACLVDQTGRRLAEASVPNTPAGYRRLAGWLAELGPVTRVGVEGTANLGAALASFLYDQGVEVCGVPGALTVRERRRLRRPGKSDPTDALAIARITARDSDLPPARQPGPATDLKVLSDYRDQLLVWRNAEANRLHADRAILCPGYGRVCRRLTAERSLAAAEQLLADLPSARAQVARCRIGRLRELDREIRDLAGQLTRLVAASRTRLTDIVGIGPSWPPASWARSARSAAFRTLTTSPPPTAPPRSRSPPGGPTATASTGAATADSTARSTMWPSPRPPGNPARSPTWPANKPRARPAARPCDASNAGSPPSSSTPSSPDPSPHQHPTPSLTWPLDHRSSTARWSGSTGPCWRSGPIGGCIAPTPPAIAPCSPGSIGTTITEPTAPSAAAHPSAASTTSPVTTPSPTLHAVSAAHGSRDPR